MGKKNKQKKREEELQRELQQANQQGNQPTHPAQEVRPGTSRQLAPPQPRLQLPFFPIRPEPPVQFPLRNQQFMQNVPRLVFPQRVQHPAIQLQPPLIPLQRPLQQPMILQRPRFVLQPRPQPPRARPAQGANMHPNPFLYQSYPEFIRSETQVMQQGMRQQLSQRLLREFESQPALQSVPMAVRLVQEQLSRCNLREAFQEGESQQDVPPPPAEAGLSPYLRQLLQGSGDLRELMNMTPEEFVRLLVYGCRIAEEIARRNQSRPCFKNIQSLCANTRCDILLPNYNITNIYTQGLSWMTKDFIYAFIRLANTWNLIRHYVGFRPGSLGNVELALGPAFSRCFREWEGNSRELTYFIMRMFCLLNNTVEAQMQHQSSSNQPTTSSGLNNQPDLQSANQQQYVSQLMDQYGLPVPQSLLNLMGTGDVFRSLSIFQSVSDTELTTPKDNQNEGEKQEATPTASKDKNIEVLKPYKEQERSDSSASSSSGMSCAGAPPEPEPPKTEETTPIRRHSDFDYNTFQSTSQDTTWMNIPEPTTSHYDAASEPTIYGRYSRYQQNVTYMDRTGYTDPSNYMDPSNYGPSTSAESMPYDQSGEVDPPYGDPAYFEELSRYMNPTPPASSVNVPPSSVNVPPSSINVPPSSINVPPSSVNAPPPKREVIDPNAPVIEEILMQDIDPYTHYELNTTESSVICFSHRTESRRTFTQARIPGQELSELAESGQVAMLMRPEKVFELDGGGLTMAGYVTLEEVLDTFESEELNNLLAYNGAANMNTGPSNLQEIRRKITSATYEYINEFVYDMIQVLVNAYAHYTSLSLETPIVAMACYKVRFYEILMKKFSNYDFSHIESDSPSVGPLKRKEKKDELKSIEF